MCRVLLATEDKYMESQRKDRAMVADCDGTCGCIGCEDVVELLAEIGPLVSCGECGHWVGAVAGQDGLDDREERA